MKVTVVFFGPLGEQAGQKEVHFELSEESTYGDLLDQIGERFGDRFHERIWDARANTFKARILSVGQGRDLDSRETPLMDGEVIRIVPVFSGG